MYAATSGGVAAAVAAAEAGASVLLLEPGRHIGGMTSGGLGYTDIGDARVLGGFAARFRAAVGEAYGVAPGHFAGPEPHVAEGILTDWLERPRIEVVLEVTVVAADVRDGRIAEVWVARDELGMLRQLGALPEPATAGAA